MSLTRIEAVSTAARIVPELVGCFIDLPKAGTELNSYCIKVDGWVLGRSCTVSAVEFLSEGSVVQRVAVGKSRPDLARAFPDNPNAISCGFCTSVDLVGVPPKFAVSLQAVCSDARRFLFGTIAGNRCPLRPDCDSTTQPLVVTTLGRSGSTWIMRLLSQHPNISAYRPFAFESRAGTYWADVFRALSAPSSYVQQLVGAPRSNARWWLGPESMEMPTYLPDRDLVDTLGGAAVKSLADFCQQQLNNFYQATSNGSRYFAEKCLPDVFVRRILFEWFPDGKEILLVRDPRDVFCSIESFNAKRGTIAFARAELSDAREYMRMLLRETSRLERTSREQPKQSHLVRYEDVVLKPASVLESTLQFLDLDASSDVIAKMIESASSETEAMRKHRTSSSNSDSVGRWQRDLPSELRELCAAEFTESMENLGYH